MGCYKTQKAFYTEWKLAGNRIIRDVFNAKPLARQLGQAEGRYPNSESDRKDYSTCNSSNL